MVSEYQNLKNSLKWTLQVFKSKLLLFHVLRGGVIIGISILFFLFFYFFCNSFFQLSVLWKTLYFYVFISVLSLECIFFIFHPFIRFLLHANLKNNLLLKEISKYFSSDIFLSVYNLAFHSDCIRGDESLKKAAFIQKYNFLISNKLSVVFPDKILLRYALAGGILLSLFLFNQVSFSKIYNDLSDYETVHPKHELSFLLLNRNLTVEYGQSLQLKLVLKSDDYRVDRVFISYSGGEFLMNRKDSVFTYDFEVINNDIQFYFKALGQQSDFYKIEVLPSPLLTAYKAIITPPAYTGLKSEVQQNTVDFRVLYGSRLKFDLSVADIDTLYLKKGEHLSDVDLNNKKNSAVLNLNVRESGEYSLVGSNRFIQKKNLLNFTVTCIPDLYPGIQITEIQDSLRASLHYYYGVITDDYGFSALRFSYSVNEETNTVIPIVFAKNRNVQEFYFSFDFAEFAGMEQSQINYYFEVFDNDNLSGPKSTRSGQKIYQLPDLNTVFDYNVEVNQNVNSALNDAEKLVRDIVSGVKELQKKMLDNNTDNWEKQQLSKDIVQKKDKLNKLLNSVKENNLKKSDLNKSFAGQDSILLAKQNQIQELLDRIMDDEMKNLMKEFSKLSEEFSKDKFNDLDEKMKLTFDQMSEELDRNIELLKRFQIEERHDLISKRLEKLKSDQLKYDDQLKNRSVRNDSLVEVGSKIKQELDNIKKDYSDLLKENSNLSEPYHLDKMEQKFDQLSEKLGQQSTENKRNRKLSEEIKKEMDELIDEMKKQQEQNFLNKSLPQNDIELIIQNILIISLSQEDLLDQFSKVEAQSLKYNELGRLQDLKRQEYKIVKDSLSLLAKSNLMLASLLSHKFYDIEIKFGLLPDYIQNNRRSDLLKEQQYIINYLNDIALTLTDALQKEQQDSKGKGKGSKENSKSGKGGEGGSGQKDGGYGQMKKFQHGLKQQLENLISKMKNGEKGKPLQQGISNMIRQNELFRKSLNDFISESGSLSNTEKQLLNEINKLLEDNIRDLSNYSVSGQLIHRNNLIYNKLLMSEKASKQREEFEEKRKSESATDVLYKRPDLKLNFMKKSGLIKTDFQKSGLKLNDYYKTMYNNYYIKLGNE